MGFADWFRRETPQEQVRRWQRVIRTEMRAVDRQVADVQRESKKTEQQIKDCAKRGDKRSMTVLARELLRTRKVVTRLYTSKAQMNSVTLHLNENLAVHRAVGHMQSSGELMKLMNGVMKQNLVAKTMMDLSREMFKAGVMDEMVGDAMDSSLDDVEEETEEEVDKILNELAVDSVAAMPAAGRQRAAAQPTQLQAAQAAEEEEDLSGLQARLDAIRAG